jgi:surfactin family lipopeptide synthetase A
MSEQTQTPSIAEKELQCHYWQQKLSDNLPILALPTDRPRQSSAGGNYASYSCQIELETISQLKHFTQSENSAISTTLLAIFQVLLYRYTNQNDLAVVSGLQLNHPVIIRNNLAENLSFKIFLNQVNRTVLEAIACQDYPLETILSETNLRVGFVWQEFNYIEQPGLDLTLALSERETSVCCNFHYDGDLFEAATIERMAGHWQNLITQIITTPDRAIAQLSLLTEAEKHQILVEWNDTQVNYPQDKCIHQLIESQAAQTPGAIALVFEEQQLTYRELNRQAEGLAAHLQNLGVKPDSLVGIYVERSLEMVVGILAILKAGGAYVPLDPNAPGERLSYILKDTKIKVLLTQSSLNSDLDLSGRSIQIVDLDRLETIIDESNSHLEAIVAPHNLAYVIYTSGSTGKPKGVQIEHRAAVNLLMAMIDGKPGICATDTLLSVTTICFDMSVPDLFLPLLVGAKVVIVSHQVAADGKQLSKAIERYHATVMQATPVSWQLLLASGWQGSSKLTVLTGGEALSPELAERLLPKCSQLWNFYGPTEATVWSSAERVISLDNPISLGKPLNNVEYYILDSHLQPLPIGLIGELHIGGIGLARGYFNRPELTKEKFIKAPLAKGSWGNRLYKTGDLARYLPDGNIEYLGRIDNQVKIRGFRIELGEIEFNLSINPQIERCVVIAREDVPGDKRLVAYLITIQDIRPSTEELKNYLGQTLPDYMIPSHFVFLDEFPLTPNNKIDRKALPAPDTSGQRKAELTQPHNDIERQLVAIWQEVLNIQPLGIQDNFFELGGHSLLAVKLFKAINHQFGTNLPLTTLFEAPTIERLASLLQKPQTTQSFDSLVLLKPGSSPTPLFLIHDANGETILYLNLARHLHPEQAVYGLRPYSKPGYPMLHTRISEMVEYYIQEIRKVQPQGPYFIGGLCAGGVLAFELACRLQAQGEQVPVVAIIDAINYHGCAQTNYANRNRQQSFLKTFARNGQSKNLAWLTNVAQKSLEKVSRLISYEIKTIIENTIERARVQLFRYYLERNLPLPQFCQNISVVTIYKFAESDYKPGLYRGKLTLWRATEKLDFSNRAIDDTPAKFEVTDPLLGWGQQATEGVEVYDIPGGHSSMLQEPNVQTMSQKLQLYIDSVPS